MIDKKKLLENLIPLLNEYGDMYFAGRIIGMIDSQQKIGDWIPCSEQLPEESGFYIVTCVHDEIGERVHELYYCENGWDFSDVITPCNAVAWQPKPEPYKP